MAIVRLPALVDAARAAALAAGVLLSRPASAEDKPAAPPAVADAAAVVPGVVVHGLGHWLSGDRSTGLSLFLMEGIGAAAAITGTLGLFVTGASRKLVAPNILLMVGGAGLFMTSWLADVYGTATGNARGEDHPTGAPQDVLPAVESALGYRHVYDPTFAYRSFVVTSLDARLGRVHLRPEGWFSPAHANERLRLLGGYRLVGPRARSLDGKSAPSPPVDGSFVDLETAVTRHAFPPERFTMTSVEAFVNARFDLHRFARSLRGAFAEGGAGWGFARHDYAIEGAEADFQDQLLARIAFGMYLGRPERGPVYGETSIVYDHRHDGFAAGLKMTGLGSGPAGNFGLRGVLWLTPELGGLAEIQAGSAIVFGASILVRQPVIP